MTLMFGHLLGSVPQTWNGDNEQLKQGGLFRSLQHSRQIELSILVLAFGMKIPRQKCKQGAGYPNELERTPH